MVRAEEGPMTTQAKGDQLGPRKGRRPLRPRGVRVTIEVAYPRYSAENPAGTGGMPEPDLHGVRTDMHNTEAPEGAYLAALDTPVLLVRGGFLLMGAGGQAPG